VSQTEVLDADYETDRNKFNHPLERRIYDNGKDETTVWVQTKHYLQEVCNENIPAQMLKQLGYV
jgi:hypothetical protein